MALKATSRYNHSRMDANSLPIITTPRLVLRWVSEDDIDSLYEIFSDPQVMRYWSSGPMTDRSAAVALQREIADANLKDTYWKWGLALRDTNKLIGTATLFNLNLDNGRAEIGYAWTRSVERHSKEQGRRSIARLPRPRTGPDVNGVG